MKKLFKTYDPDQLIMLPPALQDWLPANHLARLISGIVDALRMKAFFDSYKGGGRPAFHPRMMLKLLFYGVCVGRTSSRQLETATYDDLGMRFLAADQHPDHDSIAAFKVRHATHLREVFREILGIAAKMGLVKMGHVSIDGTKIQANASKQKTHDLEFLRKKAEELRREILEADAKQDGVSTTVDGLEKTKTLYEQIIAAKELLEAAVQAEQAAAEAESKALKEKHAAAVAEAEKMKAQFQKCADRLRELRTERGLSQRQFAELIESNRSRVKAWEGNSRRPSSVELARILSALNCDSDEFRDWLQVPPSVRQPGAAKESKSNPRTNLTDPDSKLMKPNKSSSTIQGYNAQNVVESSNQIIVAQDVVSDNHDRHCFSSMLDQAIENTGLKPDVVSADNGYLTVDALRKYADTGILVLINPGKKNMEAKSPCEEMEKLRALFSDPEMKKLYNRRSAIVEPVFGRIKCGFKFVKASMRGLTKVRFEWTLHATVHNILKILAAQ